MSSTSASFASSTAAKVALAAAVAFGAASGAQAAELGCYTNKADIEAVKAQLNSEGMIPATSHFRNGGTDKSPVWVMKTLMMNPNTRRGYEWSKHSATEVCISSAYSDVHLYNNRSLDLDSMLDKNYSPYANVIGTKGDISTTGINALLLAEEKTGRFPMYRAKVDKVLGTPTGMPKEYYEYLVSDPKNGEGVRLAANFNGKVIPEYNFTIGSPLKDKVPNGAIYSSTAKKLIEGEQLAAAPSATSPQLVLR